MHTLVHAVMAYYDYLVLINLWKDVLAVLVAGAIAWVLRIGRRLKRIESHLDTETPGGLTTLVEAVNRLNETNDKKVE